MHVRGGVVARHDMDVRRRTSGMHGQHAWGLHPGSVSASHMPFVEPPTPYDWQANALPARIGC
eukprot:4929383-Pleurochrysis_carterae.AAC.1